jgi:hypothetical protein
MFMLHFLGSTIAALAAIQLDQRNWFALGLSSLLGVRAYIL